MSIGPLKFNNLTSQNLQFRPLNFIIGPQICELVQNNHKIWFVQKPPKLSTFRPIRFLWTPQMLTEP